MPFGKSVLRRPFDLELSALERDVGLSCTLMTISVCLPVDPCTVSFATLAASSVSTATVIAFAKVSSESFTVHFESAFNGFIINGTHEPGPHGFVQWVLDTGGRRGGGGGGGGATPPLGLLHNTLHIN